VMNSAAIYIYIYIYIYIFDCGTLLVRGFVWKILFIIFLSMGQYKFVSLFVRHRTVSNRQKNSKKNCLIDTVQCLTNKFINL
jgi:hypothetical protein